jgi:hypothetical protein
MENLIILSSFVLYGPTPTAAVAGNQLPLLHIKLLRLVDQPFVMTMAAQGIALVFFLE